MNNRDWNTAYSVFQSVDGWEIAQPDHGKDGSAKLQRKLRLSDTSLTPRSNYERKIINCADDQVEPAIRAIMDLIEKTVRDCIYDPRMRSTYKLGSEETKLEIAGMEINPIAKGDGTTDIEIIIG